MILDIDQGGHLKLDAAGRQGAKRRIFQLIEFSLDVGAQCQSQGGVLLHGALAERQGGGVLLLGPSGRGKTTASGRLRPPWKSLSDDMALVMPHEAGSWSAHPWPTWSSLLSGEGGGPRDVRQAVGLGGLFFMIWAFEDRAERIGSGRASCLLLESFEQAWLAGSSQVPGEVMKSIRTQAFSNISALAREVPAFLLHISQAGTFWEAIEAALGEVRSRR